MDQPSPYRPEFLAGLRLLARISGAIDRRGFRLPILVGGAAAEIYSASAITTGDFDLCTPFQDVLEQELLAAGFVRPSGAGTALKGWIHPDVKLGFEVVADVPLEGNYDRSKLTLFNISPDETLAVLAVEDLIADRMGQWASGTAADRIEQARQLFQLNPDADIDYLDRRIREETFDECGIEALRR